MLAVKVAPVMPVGKAKACEVLGAHPAEQGPHVFFVSVIGGFLQGPGSAPLRTRELLRDGTAEIQHDDKGEQTHHQRPDLHGTLSLSWPGSGRRVCSATRWCVYR